MDAIFDPELDQVGECCDLVIPRSAVDLVSFFQQEIGQVSAILARDTDNESAPFVHGNCFSNPTYRPAANEHWHSVPIGVRPLQHPRGYSYPELPPAKSPFAKIPQPSPPQT